MHELAQQLVNGLLLGCVYARGILVQIQGQQYVSVWPFDTAAKDVTWPLRPWGKK